MRTEAFYKFIFIHYTVDIMPVASTQDVNQKDPSNGFTDVEF
jgi:hypothetical protein